MDTNISLERYYFIKLVEAFNYIPATGQQPLHVSEWWHPVRDTLAVIADRAIELEQQKGPNPFPNKEIILLELIAMAGNKDKNRAIYDIVTKINTLAFEAIYARLNKEIGNEKNEAKLKKLITEKERIEYIESWNKNHATPTDGSECGIVTAPDICLPKWYTDIYTNERCSYLRSYPIFEPIKDKPQVIHETKQSKKSSCFLF